MVPETGVIMNNEMNDFSIPGTANAFGFIPSPANFVRPGKRPLSSATPVIVEFLNNGTLYLVAGGAGGSRIITATLQALWQVLDRNATAEEAVAAPRFHDQLVPNQVRDWQYPPSMELALTMVEIWQVTFEYTYDNATTAFMTMRGHNVTWSEALSDIQVLRRLPNGTFEAAGEPRLAASGGFTV